MLFASPSGSCDFNDTRCQSDFTVIWSGPVALHSLLPPNINYLLLTTFFSQVIGLLLSRLILTYLFHMQYNIRKRIRTTMKTMLHLCDMIYLHRRQESDIISWLKWAAYMKDPLTRLSTIHLATEIDVFIYVHFVKYSMENTTLFFFVCNI